VYHHFFIPKTREEPVLAVGSALMQIPLFDGIAPDILEPIAEICMTQLFDKKTNIYKKGSWGSKFYIIQKGIVDIIGFDSTGKQFVLSTIEAGECCGEAGLLSSEGHSTTAVAREEVIAYVITRDYFKILLEKEPLSGLALLRAIGRHLSRRVRQVTEQFLFARGIASTIEDKERVEIDTFKKHPDALIAKPLDDKTIEMLKFFSECLSLGQGEIIVPEGGKKRDFYILAKGKAVVRKHLPGGATGVVKFITAGCLFGELAFLDHGLRSAEVKSLSPVILYAFWEKNIDAMETSKCKQLSVLYMCIIRHLGAYLDILTRELLSTKIRIHESMGFQKSKRNVDENNITFL